MPMTNLRIGHGYDVHRFAPDRALILGGVTVPYELGLLGHSDADVLTHALMDALLGAAGLGDIGKAFPDDAPETEGISSLILLSRVMEMLRMAGYAVVNVDATLVMQRPKVAAYLPQMVETLAHVMEIDAGQINLKATTEEKLGFTGSGAGAAAHAVALIEKMNA